MLRLIVHLGLHLLVPGMVAWRLYSDRWKNAWLVMMLTMVIDLDHLFAEPIYDPNRCGIGFHLLHSYPAIAVYVVLVAIPRTRLIGLGLVIHMVLDGLDCVYMSLW